MMTEESGMPQRLEKKAAFSDRQHLPDSAEEFQSTMIEISLTANGWEVRNWIYQFKVQK
jgi:hypothetical protein